jgi:hypothetical protein
MTRYIKNYYFDSGGISKIIFIVITSDKAKQ